MKHFEIFVDGLLVLFVLYLASTAIWVVAKLVTVDVILVLVGIIT